MRWTAALSGALGVLVSSIGGGEPAAIHGEAHASKKGGPLADPPALLATLAFVHTQDRVLLEAAAPTTDEFSKLLSDRVTGEERNLDPRLCNLLRSLVADYPGARIEMVSGFRSPKLNEMLRKKGHHVASHSQHSLGNAIDFRIIPADMVTAPRKDDLPIGIDPLVLEKKIRALGWTGGVGVYEGKRDWFVHADVGPNRRWWGK